jgi:hypothetical protein
MAKELPYFRFEPSEWDNGNIQICSRESKGLFIDLCSIYWSRLGELPYALALQKLCNGNELALQELKNNDIFGVLNGQIVIDFLDEQLSERGQVSEKRRNSALKRWNDANAMQVQSKSNANRREENRREEKKKEEKIITASKLATIETREIEFRDKLIPYIETYGKEMLRAFYDYWTEKNEGGKKMKFEMQKVFELEKRLRTWSNNNFGNNGKSKSGIVKPNFDKLASLLKARHHPEGATE